MERDVVFKGEDRGSPTDRLLDRARAGDEAALNELFQNLGPHIRRRIRRYLSAYPAVRRWGDEDDFQQEVLLRLWKAFRERRFSPVDSRGLERYVSVVVRACVRDVLRHEFSARRDVDRTVLSDPVRLDWLSASSEPTPDQLVAAEELRRRFQAALSLRERQLVALRSFGFPWDRITEVLGLSDRTARRIIGQVRERMIGLMLNARPSTRGPRPSWWSDRPDPVPDGSQIDPDEVAELEVINSSFRHRLDRLLCLLVDLRLLRLRWDQIDALLQWQPGWARDMCRLTVACWRMARCERDVGVPAEA